MTAPTGDEIRAALTAALDDTATGLYMRQYGDGWGENVTTALLPTVQQLIAQAVTTALNDAHTEVGKARDDCPNTERRRAYGYALHILRTRAQVTR